MLFAAYLQESAQITKMWTLNGTFDHTVAQIFTDLIKPPLSTDLILGA